MENEKIGQIILAADHAGFELKEHIKSFLQKKGYKVLDVGAHALVPDDDFPVYMSAAALKVAEDISGNTRALLFGGSGQGEAMMANRYPGVRAAVWYGSIAGDKEDVVALSREHNDSNVLSIGARHVTREDTERAVQKWIETAFSDDEKYARRNALIDGIE